MTTKARRPRFFWIVLGLLLLLGTAIGARYVWKNGHDVPAASAGAGEPEAPGVTALGLVDCAENVRLLAPPQGGRVDWVIREGAQVKKGDPLLKLDRRPAENQLQLAEADLESAAQQLKKAEAALEGYEPKMAQQQDAVGIARDALTIATEDYKLAKRAYDAKSIAEEKFRSAEAAKSIAERRVKLEQNKERDLEFLKAVLEADVGRAQANKTAKKAQVDIAKLALTETEIKAPSNGVVLRVQVSEGEMVGMAPKAPPIQFCPQHDSEMDPRRDRIIRAEVLQEWVDRVAVGQDVLIENDPRSTAQWRGRVKSISNWIAPRRHRVQEPFITNDVLTVECIIELTEGDAPLRINQRVRVSFPAK